jgi:hypothetical protein
LYRKDEEMKRLRLELEKVKLAQGKEAGRGNAVAGKKVDDLRPLIRRGR